MFCEWDRSGTGSASGCLMPIDWEWALGGTTASCWKIHTTQITKTVQMSDTLSLLRAAAPQQVWRNHRHDAARKLNTIQELTDSTRHKQSLASSLEFKSKSLSSFQHYDGDVQLTLKMLHTWKWFMENVSKIRMWHYKYLTGCTVHSEHYFLFKSDMFSFANEIISVQVIFMLSIYDSKSHNCHSS